MSNFEFFNVDQNTEEWQLLRSGRMTSSKLGVVMANYGKKFGEPAKKYATTIAIEQITGKYSESNYSNSHMERGHEQEPIARLKYENETFSNVSNGGFFKSDFIGCSPDGLVFEDGLIEIKSVIETTHYINIMRQGIDPSYKWQIIGNIKFTKRDWIDYISYCSEFPEDKQLYIHRSYKEDFKDEFEMIDERVEEFKNLVHQTKENIMNLKYSNIK